MSCLVLSFFFLAEGSVGIYVCSTDNNARDTLFCIRLSCYLMYNMIISDDIEYHSECAETIPRREIL